MVLVIFLLIIILITVATVRFKMHPFLTLLVAAIAVGFAGGLTGSTIVSHIGQGFGGTLKSIGIVIACGSIIGTFLERSGGAQTMASTILKVVGEKRSALAMNITGFIVSIPVFCDSGFVILSILNKALSKRTGISTSVLAIALATGLYTTHVFVPPTPGPLAAAATLGANIGLVVMLGLLVAIPTSIAGLFWAGFIGRHLETKDFEEDESKPESNIQPGVTKSFLPILLPIVLIALKSIADYPTQPFGAGLIMRFFDIVGDPIIALIIGVFVAFGLRKKGDDAFEWVSRGLANAGAIILITGAGGAFGDILRTTSIGQTVGSTMAQWHLGIFLPFLLAAFLKTAQGSSTVAIITASALMSPLLVPLGLAAPIAKALVVLAIGAGAMTVSHINDSYFWVVAQFSNMDTGTALRGLTVATLIQGVTAILTIALLSVVLL